jgi:hypothetical protein
MAEEITTDARCVQLTPLLVDSLAGNRVEIWGHYVKIRTSREKPCIITHAV